ncbi:MAG: aldo/keto reductase [Prevotella sp.]|nr:aldo/keto reductase [Prevotella sp.]
MKYIQLNGKPVSEVVLGLMRIPDKTTEEVVSLLETALDEGINMIDLADIYGDGQCETNVGRAFAARPDLRERLFVQSKCGINKHGTSFDGKPFTFFDFSREHIIQSVDGILSRLQTDHIDSLLLHRPDVLMEPGEVAEAFTQLHRQGKVLSFGVSNENPSQMELLSSALPFPIVTNQLQLSCAFTPMIDAGLNVNMQNQASIVHESGVLDYCRLKGIAVQAWSVMQHGYFEGIFLGSGKYPRLNETLQAIAARKGGETGLPVTPMALALAWILRLPHPMQAVIGTTRNSRVREAAVASAISLSREEWYEIYESAGNVLP